MKRTINTLCFSLKKITLSFFLTLAICTHQIYGTTSINVTDIIDEEGSITNPQNLTGTIDFSGFHPIIDDCKGLVFMPSPPPVAPGWNALGSGLNSNVYAIALSGNDVYVGGIFTDAGGIAEADNIARWDGSSWNALSNGLNGGGFSIAISGGDVYVGGQFTDAGGIVEADYIARWDGSSWNALGGGLNERVISIAISGSDVYVGGYFTDAAGIAEADKIAKWDGSSWNALGSGLNDNVRAIAISGSDVYVGGLFTDAGGITDADRIARWDGSSWNAMGSGLNNEGHSIAISGSDVYVGGYFTDAGGIAEADKIARWDGSSWNALGSGLNHNVFVISISGSDVYVGGFFTDAGGIAEADRIARWDGSSWNALGGGLNSFVIAIAISGSDVYAGGLFTDAGGIAEADRIARWGEAPLPVEMVDFRAKNIGNRTVSLNWQTKSETNNEGFEVQWGVSSGQWAVGNQQSGEGSGQSGVGDWETIGYVNGAGTAFTTESYQFIHDQTASGINYYRLKQMDFDGAIEYSEVVSVQLAGGSHGLVVSPNPVQNGEATLYISKADFENATLKIFNAVGKLLQSEVLLSNETNLSINDLPAGVYVFSVNWGRKTITERVMIR